MARGRPDTPQCSVDEITIKELIAAYWTFAKTHYRKDGRPTSELGLITQTMRPLARLYGISSANHFGPLALKAVRQVLIDNDLSRGVVNSHVSRIRRMFRWGVENELVSPTVFHGLQAVRGLQRGRTEARETALVLPVEQSVIDATLPHLPPIIADMVRNRRRWTAIPSRPTSMDRPSFKDTRNRPRKPSNRLILSTAIRPKNSIAWIEKSPRLILGVQNGERIKSRDT